jgi:MoaA/NifB/PqqE/SkfB family radical SAM enzyme
VYSGPPRTTLLALMVTRRCNMTCAHCSVESGPQHKAQPTLQELQESVDAAAGAGIRAILITGGEPMLREKEVLVLIKQVRKHGIACLMTSNGFWGKNPAAAARKLRALRRAGLVGLTISYDRYHAQFQGPQPALNIVHAAAQEYFPVNINVTRAAGDNDLQEIVGPFEQDEIARRHARLRFYDVQPVGRARGFEEDDLRGEIEGFCGACNVPSLSDDGRLTACNGPSYFAPEFSPLNIGSLKKSTLAQLLSQHADDPILDTIRTFGPSRLRDELKQMTGFEDFPFRERYAGMCQLCAHVTGDEKAVAALRERLGREKYVAEREAKRRVMDVQRRGGTLDFFTVNSTARSLIFLSAVRGLEWPADTMRVLGRADFDWKAAADYLCDCGLARPLAARLQDPQLLRWAPPFFIERIREHATREALRELIAREALKRIDAALQELGAFGVLLKGAALVARSGKNEPTRALSDIDLFVEPKYADSLRALLLQREFAGDPSAVRTGAHHLAPVHFRSIPVEIHTRLQSAFWGLPETAIVEQRMPLAHFHRLYTLGLEGSVVLTAMHLSTHIYAGGLKAAWDLSLLLENEAALSVERVLHWVNESTSPRAFWTTLKVLHDVLPQGVPRALLRHAPHDQRQAKLELVARRRAFIVCDHAAELNPLSRNAYFWLLLETPSARLRLLIFLMGRDAREARQATDGRPHSKLAAASWKQQLQQVKFQWKQYRAATNCPDFQAAIAKEDVELLG